MKESTVPPRVKKIADRIKEARELSGESQEKVCHQLGVTVRTYSRWETGTSAGFLSRINDIAKVIGVKPEELLGDQATVMIEILEEVQSQRVLLEEILEVVGPKVKGKAKAKA